MKKYTIKETKDFISGAMYKKIVIEKEPITTTPPAEEYGEMQLKQIIDQKNHQIEQLENQKASVEAEKAIFVDYLNELIK